MQGSSCFSSDRVPFVPEVPFLPVPDCFAVDGACSGCQALLCFMKSLGLRFFCPLHADTLGFMTCNLSRCCTCYFETISDSMMLACFTFTCLFSFIFQECVFPLYIAVSAHCLDTVTGHDLKSGIGVRNFKSACGEFFVESMPHRPIAISEDVSSTREDNFTCF